MRASRLILMRIEPRPRRLSTGALRAGLAASCLLLGMAWLPGKARACEAPVLVELSGEAFFSHPSERDHARQSAIRHGVVDALQRAAGAEIARGSQVATTSTLSSIERETSEHIVIRSGGRVMGWEVTGEERREIEGMDSAALVVTLKVEVCPSMDRPAPLVLAIGSIADASPELDAVLRARLAEAFAGSEALQVVRDLPRDAYHDLRIELDHTAERREIDNTDNAAILSRFRNPEILDESALRYQLVTVSVTLSAVRFVDRQTISYSIQRRGRLPPDAPTEAMVAALLSEAALLAAAPVLDALDGGALDYARR